MTRWQFIRTLAADLACRLGLHPFEQRGGYRRRCRHCGRREVFFYSPEGGWDQGDWIKLPDRKP